MIGAPTVGVEKLPSGDEGVRLRDHLEVITGRRAVAVMSSEIGGSNGLLPGRLGRADGPSARGRRQHGPRVPRGAPGLPARRRALARPDRDGRRDRQRGDPASRRRALGRAHRARRHGGLRRHRGHGRLRDERRRGARRRRSRARSAVRSRSVARSAMPRAIPSRRCSTSSAACA